MQKDSVVTIVSALNRRGVRYLIVGGLAAVAHGSVRFTADVDVMLAWDEPNVRRAIAALTALGYRPRAPVKFEALLDRSERERWARERNMTVFSLYSDAHRLTEIDFLLDAPIEFEHAWARSVRKPVAPGVEAPFCGVDDLIELKSGTGRARDRDDVERLKRLTEDS